jgi:hypothetical protein
MAPRELASLTETGGAASEAEWGLALEREAVIRPARCAGPAAVTSPEMCRLPKTPTTKIIFKKSTPPSVPRSREQFQFC